MNDLLNNKVSLKNQILYLNENIKKEILTLNNEEKILNNQVVNIYNKYENEINIGNNNPWVIDLETQKPCRFLESTCFNEDYKNIIYNNYINFINSNIHEIMKNKPNKKQIKDFLLIEKLYEEYMKASNNRFILLQDRISNELKISKLEAKNLINLYHKYLREKNNYKKCQ